MALKYVSTLSGTTAQRASVGGIGTRFAIQPDNACYVAVGDSTVEATATNGILVAAAGLLEDVVGDPTNTYVSMLPVSGTVNAKLFVG